MENYDIDILMERYLRDEMSETERADFEARLSADPALLAELKLRVGVLKAFDAEDAGMEEARRVTQLMLKDMDRSARLRKWGTLALAVIILLLLCWLVLRDKGANQAAAIPSLPQDSVVPKPSPAPVETVKNTPLPNTAQAEDMWPKEMRTLLSKQQAMMDSVRLCRKQKGLGYAFSGPRNINSATDSLKVWKEKYGNNPTLLQRKQKLLLTQEQENLRVVEEAFQDCVKQ